MVGFSNVFGCNLINFHQNELLEFQDILKVTKYNFKKSTFSSKISLKEINTETNVLNKKLTTL